MTEPSYRRWHARLSADDLAHPGTAGFIRFMQERMKDRDERAAAMDPASEEADDDS